MFKKKHAPSRPAPAQGVLPQPHAAYGLQYGMNEQELDARIGSNFLTVTAGQLYGRSGDPKSEDECRLYSHTLPEHDIQLVMRDGCLLTAGIVDTEGDVDHVVVKIDKEGTKTPNVGYALFAVGELFGRFGVISEATAQQARTGSEKRGLVFEAGSTPQIMELLLRAVKRDAQRRGHNGYRVRADASCGELVMTSVGTGADFPRDYHLWVVEGAGLALAATSL